MIGPVSDKKSVANNYPNMVNLIYLSCRHWWFGTIRSRQVLNLQRPRILFVLVAPLFIILIVFLSLKAGILLL